MLASNQELQWAPLQVRRALMSLKSRLQATFGDRFREMRLFGSFARGEEHEESDIDVLLLFADELSTADVDLLFCDVAEVDRAERVWISPLFRSEAQFRRMLEDEIGVALAIEEEGIRV